MKRLNEFRSGSIYDSYLIIRKRNETEQVVCAFNGQLKRMVDIEGEEHPIYLSIQELLEGYIEQNGHFFQHNGSIAIIKVAGGRRIEEILYDFYHYCPKSHSEKDGSHVGHNLENRSHMVINGKRENGKIKLIFSFVASRQSGGKRKDERKITLGNNTEIRYTGADHPEEAAFINLNRTYDCTITNLKSVEHATAGCSNGTVFWGKNGIEITCQGKWFYTDYDRELISLLQRLSEWHVDNGGALKTKIGDTEIPFSEIVWAFYHGKLSGNMNIRKALVNTHKTFAGAKAEIDHLTENKANNYIFSLAQTTNSVNRSMLNYRGRIVQPYFFYTVYHKEERKLLVACGLEGKWEQRFSFDLFADYGAEYAKCFHEFKKTVDAEHVMKKPGNSSLLHYWSDPQRAFEADNPLTQLLDQPLDTFIQYSDGAFEEMPTIES